MFSMATRCPNAFQSEASWTCPVEHNRPLFGYELCQRRKQRRFLLSGERARSMKRDVAVAIEIHTGNRAQQGLHFSEAQSGKFNAVGPGLACQQCQSRGKIGPQPPRPLKIRYASLKDSVLYGELTESLVKFSEQTEPALSRFWVRTKVPDPSDHETPETPGSPQPRLQQLRV